MAHEDGILLGTQLVGEHLRMFVADGQGLEMVVEVAVGRLRPLQDDVRTVLAVIGEETAVQPLALCLQHAYRHVDAGILQSLYATPLHLTERVDAAHHDAAHAPAHNEVGTGRGLAVMRAGLQRHIEGGILQQRLVVGVYGGKGIHLGMGLAAAHMVALADDAAVGRRCLSVVAVSVRTDGGHDHGSNHGVGPRTVDAVGCQLQAAVHVSFVVGHGFICQMVSFLLVQRYIIFTILQ